MWFLHKQTWWQVYQGNFFCLHCNYILSKDCRMFDTVVIRDPGNFSSDNFILHIRILRRNTRCHGQYLQG